MKFTQEAWTKLLENSVEKIKTLASVKNGEYSGTDDFLANFRRNADAADVPMELVWRIYASKHWDAIMNYEHDLRIGKRRERSEGIDGRIDDLIVYLLLFKAMYEERTKPLAPESAFGTTVKFYR